jgi:hypothetical protein
MKVLRVGGKEYERGEGWMGKNRGKGEEMG